jgi:vacuolar-type H+-ATPase subunit H
MQTSSQPEFIKTIGEIKGAEEEYDRLILEAKEKADRVMREAKEKVADERAKNSDNIVKYKNEQLRAGSNEIETEVNELIDKAKDGSSKVSGKKLTPVQVGKLVKDFLNNL